MPLLYMEPSGPPTETPVIDEATRRMTAAFRKASEPSFTYMGVHTCACGAVSSSTDYLLPEQNQTNSLCIHYLAHHRDEVPAQDLATVLRLDAGQEEPSPEELQGPSMTRPRVLAEIRRRLGRAIPLLEQASFDIERFADWFRADTPQRGNAQTILSMLNNVPGEEMDSFGRLLLERRAAAGGVPDLLDVERRPREAWLPIWEQSLTSAHGRVRIAAVRGIAGLGGDRHGADTRLTTVMREDPDRDVRSEALDLWLRHSTNVVWRGPAPRGETVAPRDETAACRLLAEIAGRDADPGIRTCALTNLGKRIAGAISPPVAELLRIAVADESLARRALAFQCLSCLPEAGTHLQQGGSACVVSLIDCVLHDNDRQVHDAIEQLLLKMPCEPFVLAGPFARALAHADYRVRLRSARMLARNPAVAKLAVGALRVASGDSSTDVAYAAAAALQRIGRS